MYDSHVDTGAREGSHKHHLVWDVDQFQQDQAMLLLFPSHSILDTNKYDFSGWLSHL